jgi:hypothetical protein
LSTKTSPKGEFECKKATSTKCESLVVRVTFRIQFFWVFRVMMLIFLIFRAEAYTCWSARFARSVLVVLRVYLNRFRFFSDSGIFLGQISHLWLFITKKDRFLAILSEFGVF